MILKDCQYCVVWRRGHAARAARDRRTSLGFQTECSRISLARIRQTLMFGILALSQHLEEAITDGDEYTCKMEGVQGGRNADVW